MLLNQLTNNFQTLDNISEFTKKFHQVKKTGNVNMDISGDPILTIAVELGDYYMVETLIHLGADINAIRETKYAYGNTSLIEACRFGYYDIAKLLIENGASIDVKNFMGNSALMFAVSNRHGKVVQLLLENGALVDNPDKNNDTPLLIASYKGYDDIIEILLSHGANIHHKDNDEEDAFHLAKKGGNYQTIEILKSMA